MFEMINNFQEYTGKNYPKVMRDKAVAGIQKVSNKLKEIQKKFNEITWKSEWIKLNECKDELESVLEDLKYSSIYIDYLLHQDIKNINTKISKNKEGVPVKDLNNTLKKLQKFMKKRRS